MFFPRNKSNLCLSTTTALRLLQNVQEKKNVNYGFERTFFIFYEVKIAGRLRVQHVGKFDI